LFLEELPSLSSNVFGSANLPVVAVVEMLVGWKFYFSAKPENWLKRLIEEET
jgi:hypothetical protein